MSASAPGGLAVVERIGSVCALPSRSARPRLLLLIVDPEPELVDPLGAQLAGHQIDVITCHDPADALVQAGILLPDAVLAAASLPPMSGSTIASALSNRTCVPVVVGVRNADAVEATAALAAGATACVRRPYRISEILPLLRSIRPSSSTNHEPPIDAGALRLDPATMQVHFHGALLRLPLREFHLLQLLMTHADRVVPRQEIVRLLWNGDDASNTVNVHVRRVRAHLGDDPQDPRIILTVRGMGYRLVPPQPRL